MNVKSLLTEIINCATESRLVSFAGAAMFLTIDHILDWKAGLWGKMPQSGITHVY